MTDLVLQFLKVIFKFLCQIILTYTLILWFKDFFPVIIFLTKLYILYLIGWFNCNLSTLWYFSTLTVFFNSETKGKILKKLGCYNSKIIPNFSRDIFTFARTLIKLTAYILLSIQSVLKPFLFKSWTFLEFWLFKFYAIKSLFMYFKMLIWLYCIESIFIVCILKVLWFIPNI